MDRYAEWECPAVRSEQRRFRFPNGYGASVVWHEYSYGGLEMGVLRFDHEGDSGHLTYETPITNDVLGYLDPDSLAEHLAAVKALPPWFQPTRFGRSTDDGDGIPTVEEPSPNGRSTDG